MNRHHNALPFAAAPAFMKALRAKGTMAAFLLEFVVLTAVRTTEARAATWDEIDFDQRQWTVPEERMKTKVVHNVPLSAPAIKLLVRLWDIRNSLPDTERSNYVFPSARPTTCLSNMAMLSLLKKGMGRRDITPHGMRSTFRDYVSECTEFSSEIAEAALAHKLRNKVEAAYRRGDLLQKRRVMMEAWALYLEGSS